MEKIHDAMEKIIVDRKLQLKANTRLMMEGFCYDPDGTIYFNWSKMDPSAWISKFNTNAEIILESAEQRQDKEDIIEIVKMFYGDEAVQLLRKHMRAPFQFVDMHNQGITMKIWKDEDLV